MFSRLHLTRLLAAGFLRTALERLFVHITLLVWLTCSFCDSAEDYSKPLRIYAAASLTSVMPEVAEVFQRDHPHAKIEFNFAASSILAKQIEHGAAADIFVSANTQWIDFLENKHHVQSNSRVELLSNKLVLIVPSKDKKTVTSLHDLERPDVQRIALADWAHVPAGLYSKIALENYGIWRNIESKCIPALDVRAALSYVERGDADCGIVYLTDVTISQKVKIAMELPAGIQPDIRYTAIMTRSSTHPLARSFLSFLISREAEAVFKQHGFVIVEKMPDR
ncbi:MAG: molybdate ABC transporter substrate-binding protein [bacterium]